MAKAKLMERRLTSDLFIDYENKNIYDNVKNAQHVYLIGISEHYYDKVEYMSLYNANAYNGHKNSVQQHGQAV